MRDILSKLVNSGSALYVDSPVIVNSPAILHWFSSVFLSSHSAFVSLGFMLQRAQITAGCSILCFVNSMSFSAYGVSSNGW